MLTIHEKPNTKGGGGGSISQCLLGSNIICFCLVHKKSPRFYLSTDGHTDPSIWEMKKEESEYNGYPQLYRELENGLGCMRPVSRRWERVGREKR